MTRTAPGNQRNRRRRVAARTAAILATAMALAVPSAAPAAEPRAGASALGTDCGRVDIGYTNARTYGIRVSCAYARGLFRSWLARPTTPNRPPPRVRSVRGFRCVFGGAHVVKLDCYRGAQVVRGRWGD